MYYTVYKIINKTDDKFYIGIHQTDNLNDGYMGSGKLIRRAIEKHGIDNFTKEILYVFDNPEDMKSKEAELVTQSLIDEGQCYNLCPGGHGGWGFVNNEGLNKFTIEDAISGGIARSNKLKADLEYKLSYSKKLSNTIKEKYDSGWCNPMQNRKHSEESKNKMRKSKNIGHKNPSYGTIWISNGKECKKIKKDEMIPEGWYRGRK